MTAKEKKAASARMKAVWAKRKAVSSVTATASVSNGFTVAHQPLIDVIPAGEVHDIVVIVDFMRKISPNGRKFIIKKFTPNA